MAQKRKAQDAFETNTGQLSAIAAAKLARRAAQVQPGISSAQPGSIAENLANVIAADPYDGGHSGSNTPQATSADDGPDSNVPGKLNSLYLSNWRSSRDNVLRNDEVCLELLLKEDEAVAFVGQYGMEVVSGIVSVYGCAVRPSSGMLRVYAPATHALPLIRARQSRATVRILSVDSIGPEGLERLSPLFRNLWRADEDTRTFSPIDGRLKRSYDVLDIDRDTELILKRVSAKVSVERYKPRIMAIGAKSSGKSTFNRTLCNYLLSWSGCTKIMYLDLDPGQPEFGPPGQVSLVEVSALILGPPFTHFASSSSKSYKLIRSHSLAATTFKQDPELYISCALDLVQRIGKDQIMVVNSCGWVVGIGAIALTDLLTKLTISDAVVLEPLDKSLGESIETGGPANLTIHRVPRRTARPSPRTPAEMRAMQTMSYMHQRFQPPPFEPKWTAKPLCKARPWTVTYGGKNSAIKAILSYGNDPPPAHFAEVLNGSIVAIVALDHGAPESPFLLHKGDLAERSHYRKDSSGNQIPQIVIPAQNTIAKLDPSGSSCFGLAMIHCIDKENHILHLHTPLSDSDIADLSSKTVFLVRGSFDSPDWAYVEDLWMNDASDDAWSSKERDPRSRISRPWVSRKGRAGIEGAVWRLRHPPLPSSTR